MVSVMAVENVRWENAFVPQDSQAKHAKSVKCAPRDAQIMEFVWTANVCVSQVTLGLRATKPLAANRTHVKTACVHKVNAFAPTALLVQHVL